MTPQRNQDRLAKAVEAWSNLRPTKSFAGMTLDEFKAAIKLSLDTRATIADAEATAAAAVVQRDNADAETLPTVLRVVHAVVADKIEGNDGELYKAMGYVRRSERATGLTRRRRNSDTQPEVAKAT